MDTDCSEKRREFLDDLFNLMERHGAEFKLKGTGFSVELLYDLHAGFGCDYATDEYITSIALGGYENELEEIVGLDLISKLR